MRQKGIRAAAIALTVFTLQQMIPFALDKEKEYPAAGNQTAKISALQELPRLSLHLSGLEESEYLLYAGIDLAVLEENEAGADSEADIDGDGRIYKVKTGKVRRFLTRCMQITIDLGKETDYKKGVRHRLAMRTLYASPVSGEIIIADQSNGKDGWVMLTGSEFMLSFFSDDGEGTGMVGHTEKWEENRRRYNEAKAETSGQEGEEKRPYHMFWSGEMLMLTVGTKERVCGEGQQTCDERCGIEVVIYEERGGVWTSPYPPVWLEERGEEENSASGEANTKRHIYQGNLWHDDMIHKWGNDKPEFLRVTATPVVNGRAVTEDIKEDMIVIDNRDLFFRIHQKSKLQPDIVRRLDLGF